MDDGEIWSLNDDVLEAVDEDDALGSFDWHTPEGDTLSDILAARGGRYGAFWDNSEVSQELKAALRNGVNYGALYSDQKEALDQFACKISRIVTGDPDYADNWDDIAGYAKLVADRLRRDQEGVPEGAR